MLSNLDHRYMDWVNKWNDSLVSGDEEICIESSTKLSYYALECQNHGTGVPVENLKQIVSGLFMTLVANPEGKITNLLARTWMTKPESRIPIALLTLKKALTPLFPETQIPDNTCEREIEQLLLALDANLAERSFQGVSAEDILSTVSSIQKVNKHRLNDEVKRVSLMSFNVDIELDPMQDRMKNLIREICQDPAINNEEIDDCVSCAHEILMRFICKNPSMITKDLLPNLKLFSLTIALKLTVDADLTCLKILETLNAMGMFAFGLESSHKDLVRFSFISMVVNFLINAKTELDPSLTDSFNQIQADFNAELDQLRQEREGIVVSEENFLMNVRDQLNWVDQETAGVVDQLERAALNAELYAEAEKRDTTERDADFNGESLQVETFPTRDRNPMALVD